MAASTDTKRERTRTLLIEAGERLLRGDQPWNKITVAEIAAEAGVVKATFFNNFDGGKEELLTVIMLKLTREVMEEIVGFEESLPGMRQAVEMVIDKLQTNWQLVVMTLLFKPAERKPYRGFFTDVWLEAALHRGYTQFHKGLLDREELASVLVKPILETVVEKGDTSLDGPNLRPVWTVVNAYIETAVAIGRPTPTEEELHRPADVSQEFWETLSPRAKQAWNTNELNGSEKEGLLKGFHSRPVRS
jgi:AcrR family transcriptional regulator